MQRRGASRRCVTRALQAARGMQPWSFAGPIKTCSNRRLWRFTGNQRVQYHPATPFISETWTAAYTQPAAHWPILVSDTTLFRGRRLGDGPAPTKATIRSITKNNSNILLFLLGFIAWSSRTRSVNPVSISRGIKSKLYHVLAGGPCASGRFLACRTFCRHLKSDPIRCVTLRHSAIFIPFRCAGRMSCPFGLHDPDPLPT